MQNNTPGTMELLSPAGSLEKLKVALMFGADAAYMGLWNFSLRTRATNFLPQDIQAVKDLKKKYGAKLYCTTNIFFHENDIANLKNNLEEMKDFPFDAFIISDIGILDLMKKTFPNAEMHLSTQANCINSSAAAMYRKMGFDRIILGRETPLSDIKKIKDANPDLKIEAFVHGAMCMAYSGRCLLSAHLSGRSANQGDCSHTCRWNYRLALEEEQRPGIYMPIAEENNWTTILSSKDLCMIDHLKDLQDAGVDSLKIEGRMKSIYYTALVTRAYRKALDALYGKIDKLEANKYRDDLFNVSHREFSTGFFYSNSETENRNDNITSDSYIREYSFLGTIGKQIKPNTWNVDIKNQIMNHEKLEFIGPDFLYLEDSDPVTLDENFNETEHLDHCKTGYLVSKMPLKEGFLIRKINKN